MNNPAALPPKSEVIFAQTLKVERGSGYSRVNRVCNRKCADAESYHR